jgi:antitoxin component YwqK of YwqJK toxin-antitoxin module
MAMLRPRTPLDRLPLCTVLVLASALVALVFVRTPLRQVDPALAAQAPEPQVGEAARPDASTAESTRVAALVSQVVEAGARLAAGGPEPRPPSPSEPRLTLAPHAAPSGSGDGSVERWVVSDADGRRFAEGALIEGQLDGTWRFWHENGVLMAEGAFRDGRPEGAWREWYADGRPRLEARWGESGLEGRFIEWWEDGLLRREGSFDRGLREGKWASWHANGELRAEGLYAQGLRDGPWTASYPSGLPMQQGTYVAGRREGVWNAWYEDGSVAEAGRFDGGLREGWWTFRSSDGSLDARTGFYSAGKLLR